MKRMLLAALLLPLLFSSASPQTREKTRNVAILVYEGVELLDFAGPGEVFAAAGHGAFHVYTVADRAGPVTSMGFLTIVPQYTIDDCPTPDIIVVPGGGVPAQNERLQAWVAHHRKTGELLMSVCNGAALLARAGVLAGLEVTTHHSTFDSVIAGEPTAAALVNRRFVDHGALLTTAGISAGIDGALHVVARLAGQEVAQATATYMEYDWRPEEIAELHAQPGIRYDRQAELLLATIEEQGLAGAVESYHAARARQTETDRTTPSQRRLSAMASTLLGQERTDEALVLFEFVVAAYPDSAEARTNLEEALEVASGEFDSTYACPPCGGDCDAAEQKTPGTCPGCGMTLQRRAAEPRPQRSTTGN